MAAKRRKKRMSGFAKGMIVYVVIFAVIIAVGLSFFYRFLENYEYTRPNNVMARFMETVGEREAELMGKDFADSLNPDFTDRQAVLDYITQQLKSADYAKKPAESTYEKTVYALKNEDGVFGTVYFTLGENVFHGLFDNWQFGGGSVEFPELKNEMEITVPAGYSVELNGTVLNERYVTDSSVQYALLKEFYEDYELPFMVSYRADNFMGDAAVVVRDESGKVVEPDDLREEYFTDNCTQSEKDTLKDFVDRYIELYVTYTSGANHASYVNYQNLKKLIVPDSELLYRVEQAIGGLGFASSRGDEIKGITVNRYMKLGDDRYLCDVTYDVATIGQDGLHEYPNYTKIMIVNTEYGLLTETMASY